MGKRICTSAEKELRESASCCERHREAYLAESHMSRYDADIHLLVCVARRGRPYTAMLMYVYFRVFGWIHWYWHRGFGAKE